MFGGQLIRRIGASSVSRTPDSGLLLVWRGLAFGLCATLLAILGLLLPLGCSVRLLGQSVLTKLGLLTHSEEATTTRAEQWAISGAEHLAQSDGASSARQSRPPSSQTNARKSSNRSGTPSSPFRRSSIMSMWSPPN